MAESAEEVDPVERDRRFFRAAKEVIGSYDIDRVADGGSTIRLVIGRGWGQGPTHSQHLQAWFTHIPGLKVVMPTTPADAKGLLLSKSSILKG